MSHKVIRQIEEINETWQGYFTGACSAEFAEKLDALCSMFTNSERITAPATMEQVKSLFAFESLPETGGGLLEFVDSLQQSLIPYSVNTNSPYFIGHMNSRLPDFIHPLSKLLTSLNQNQVKVETAKASTFLERQALAMLHELFYCHSEGDYQASMVSDKCTLGTITSGGTLANLVALCCARNRSIQEHGNVESEGIAAVLNKGGYSRAVVICSKRAHYSIAKSMGVLGLGRANLLTVDVDSHQRMDINALRKMIQRCRAENCHIVAIVALAGSTESGSYDDLQSLSTIAMEHSIHLHVDAAWGGAVALSKKHRHLLQGVEYADSISIDGHKQLYLPMGIGFCLFKDPVSLETIGSEANYIIRNESSDLGRFSLEGSRAAMVVYFHAMFKALGQRGLASVIDKNIDTAKQFARYINTCSDFELLSFPESNIFLYRYMPEHLRGKSTYHNSEILEINALNTRLQETQAQLGMSFVSRTKFDTASSDVVTALRVVIANPLTEFSHCKQVLNEQRQIVSGGLGFD